MGIKDTGVVEASADNGTVGIVEKYFLLRMPLRHLLADSNQRRVTHQLGRVFNTSSLLWMSNSIPNQLGALLILLTFGMFVPLLAMIIITSIIVQAVLVHLIVGKFLVREMSVMEQHLHLANTQSRSPMAARIDVPEHILYSDEFQQQVKEAREPWGAIAALKHVNALCSEIPGSVFPGSRDVYAVATAAVVAFVVSDIYNSRVGVQSYQAFLPIFILCVPPLFALALRFYFKKGTINEVKLESHTDKEVTGAGMVANNGSLTAKADVAHHTDPHKIDKGMNPLHSSNSNEYL